MIFKSFVTTGVNFCKIYWLYSYSQGKNIFSFYPPFFERLTGRSVGLSLFLVAGMSNYAKIIGEGQKIFR